MRWEGTSRKELNPCSPLSLPMPLSFIPPQGTWQKHGWEQFTQTMPVRNALDSLSLLPASEVRIAEQDTARGA